MRALPLSLAILLAGCPDPPAKCHDDGNAIECPPGDPPTFDALYSEVLAPSCAIAGSASCHGEGGLNDLQLLSSGEALEALRPYLEGGVPCSELTARVTSTDTFYRMPPTRSLPLDQQCAIERFVEAYEASGD